MPYLFDTDAISETFKRVPKARYIEWLAQIPRNEQYTSAVVIGELYKGAYTSTARERYLDYIDNRILPVISVIPYDVAISRVYGQIISHLRSKGKVIEDADLQIGATAVFHGIELVTGNLKHYERIPGLKINRILAES